MAATLGALEAGSELAHGVAEKADAPNLTGPARPLSRRAHNDIEAGLATPDPDGDIVWVSPADILAKRIVPLPPPVAEALRRASAATIDAARWAASISSVDAPNPAGKADPPELSVGDPRQHPVPGPALKRSPRR